jgi:alanyl-tRNA synthetase
MYTGCPKFNRQQLPMKTQEIRQRFLDYFARQGHAVVDSSPLVPGNDPTLLFTNAGMVQFKDVFLGQEHRSYSRAATAQRCVRAGGKHNDLENVGYTARHHTFFEMLGNFSFGDYFKREAIRFAWDFLTRELGLPADRLWVTVFHEDQEAEDIWFNEVGIDQTRFSRLGEKDNFWSMGDTGPCGPCSEIFYDHGPDVAGGPPGSPDDDGDRYIEIWNLVFMQFNRHADGTMEPLPRPSVDTGMGLERIAAVIQGVHSNYEIDTFQALIRAAARALGVADLDLDSPSLKVIADHLRAAVFLVLDGVLPGNEGRGNVLRRIIRRALRHGHKLGCTDPFFHTLVPALVKQMAYASDHLTEQSSFIASVLEKEEAQFSRTLDKGMQVLETALAELDSDQIPGALAFQLYDTYGFPLDLTADIARERGLAVDEAGFVAAMNTQRERARQASKFGVDYNADATLEGQSAFVGYEDLTESSEVTTLLREGVPVDRLQEGEQGAVVLAETPFYAESGGQVGDTGHIHAEHWDFEVTDTRKLGDLIVHEGVVRAGSPALGDVAEAHVNAVNRQAVRRHHTATHLLHAVLREVLGTHVQQKGSRVAPEALRFDFSHPEPLTPAQIESINHRVNHLIMANSTVATALMSYDDARQSGAMALFGEKYGDEVRVLSMAEGFSVELCGGTHAGRTGDLGCFQVTSEGGVAAGIRRIEAVTGEAALEWIRALHGRQLEMGGLLKSAPDELPDRLRQLLSRQKQLEKDIQALRVKMASGAGSDPAAEAILVGDVHLLVKRIEGADPASLRTTMDQLRHRLGHAVVFLATVNEGKVQMVCGVDRKLSDRIRAGDLMRHVAQAIGGKGGGRPDMAQGGGPDTSALEGALASVEGWVRDKLDG